MIEWQKLIKTAGYGVLFGSVVAGTVTFAWNGPGTLTPPNCDPVNVQGCNIPINTGSTDQIKSGNITAGDFFDTTQNSLVSNAWFPGSPTSGGGTVSGGAGNAVCPNGSLMYGFTAAVTQVVVGGYFTTNETAYCYYGYGAF